MPQHRPQRTCIGCRATRDRHSLVRVAHTPDDRYILDSTGKAPGRGAYLCPSPECLALALKRRALARAFRQALPPHAAAALEAALRSSLAPGPANHSAATREISTP